MIIWLKKYSKGLILALFFGAAALVWYAVFAESRRGLEVDFLDVGQGDAIFIQAENGNQVLLDGGPNKAVLAQLAKAMPFYDRSLDLLISSHPHSDHITGLVEVLKRYNTSAAVESCVNYQSPEFSEWENIIENEKIPHFCARRGMRINLDKNLYLDILLPAAAGGFSDPHAGMLVAKLVYGKTSYLLMGDAEKPLENYLVALEGEKLKTNVIKIGHHGSNKSTSESLLGFGAPEYAVISVGKDNKYGHPNKETLDILEKFDIQILRTDLFGTIVMKSDGEDITPR